MPKATHIPDEIAQAAQAVLHAHKYREAAQRALNSAQDSLAAANENLREQLLDNPQVFAGKKTVDLGPLKASFRKQKAKRQPIDGKTWKDVQAAWRKLKADTPAVSKLFYKKEDLGLDQSILAGLNKITLTKLDLEDIDTDDQEFSVHIKASKR